MLPRQYTAIVLVFNHWVLVGLIAGSLAIAFGVVYLLSRQRYATAIPLWQMFLILLGAYVLIFVVTASLLCILGGQSVVSADLIRAW